MTTKSTDKKDKSIDEAAAVGKPKSSLQSPVTTDIPSGTAPDTTEVDLSKAKVQVPRSAITETAAPVRELSEEDEADLDAVNKDPMTRANDAGIGLIKILGADADYVGVAPGREKDPIGPHGLPVSPSRATFTPLGNVPFSNSTRVKDPKSGEFYFPPDGCTSWEGCNLDGSYLIPQEADKAAVNARRQGKIDSLARG